MTDKFAQRKMLFLPLAFAFSWLGVQVGLGFRIGAFNIKTFGPTKSANSEVMDILAKIVRRYDIILIQEVKDAENKAIGKLLILVNSDQSDMQYERIISERLGRSKSKEQYAFLYRKDAGITVKSSYVFDDGEEAHGNDTFEREPFVVKFHVATTVVSDLVMIGVHTKPAHAVSEIALLTDVAYEAEARLGTSNIIIMGDLNADCTYVPQKSWPSIPIRHDSQFTWLVPDDADTTTKSTDCAYDRFILKGEELRVAVVPQSAKVFRFDEEYHMTDDSKVHAVSDHYPIEFELEERPTSGSQALFYGCVTVCVLVAQQVINRRMR